MFEYLTSTCKKDKVEFTFSFKRLLYISIPKIEMNAPFLNSETVKPKCADLCKTHLHIFNGEYTDSLNLRTCRK